MKAKGVRVLNVLALAIILASLTLLAYIALAGIHVTYYVPVHIPMNYLGVVYHKDTVADDVYVWLERYNPSYYRPPDFWQWWRVWKPHEWFEIWVNNHGGCIVENGDIICILASVDAVFGVDEYFT